AACATPQATPSAAVTTLGHAAGRWFKLDWAAQPDGTDARRVDGYILNTYGQAAQVQLLAQALDASGQVIDQKIEYTLAPVPGFGRSYRSEEHTSELQSRGHLVCRPLLQKKKSPRLPPLS